MTDILPHNGARPSPAVRPTGVSPVVFDSAGGTPAGRTGQRPVLLTRRQFTKTLGGVAALATFFPLIGWAADEPKVSADAAKIYLDSFILDGDAIAGIG